MSFKEEIEKKLSELYPDNIAMAVFGEEVSKITAELILKEMELKRHELNYESSGGYLSPGEYKGFKTACEFIKSYIEGKK